MHIEQNVLNKFYKLKSSAYITIDYVSILEYYNVITIKEKRVQDREGARACNHHDAGYTAKIMRRFIR